MKQKGVFFSNVPISDGSLEYWVEYVSDCKNQFPSIIVTPNVDHFNRLDYDEGFRVLYSKSDFIICDSRIIQKVSFCLEDNPIRHVVPGSDLTSRVLSNLTGSERKVFIVGSSDEHVREIKFKYNLCALESFSPSMGFIKNDQEVESIISSIVSFDPEIVFIAVGSPQQEIMAVKLKDRYLELGLTGTPIFLCVGASIDFIVGKVKRAPIFIQKAHLEWLHRACSEPRRLVPRYYKNFIWLSKYALRKLKSKLIRMVSFG